MMEATTRRPTHLLYSFFYLFYVVAFTTTQWLPLLLTKIYRSCSFISIPLWGLHKARRGVGLNLLIAQVYWA